MDAPIFMAQRDKWLKNTSLLSYMLSVQLFSKDQYFSIVFLSLQLIFHVLWQLKRWNWMSMFKMMNFAASKTVITFRVYVRLMSANLNTYFLSHLPSNSQETVLLWQTYFFYSKIAQIRWVLSFRWAWNSKFSSF